MADPVFKAEVYSVGDISAPAGVVPLDWKAWNAYLNRLGHRTEVEVIIRKPRKHRSNNQNAYYWGVVIDILSKHFGYNPEEMHDALLAEFSRDQSRALQEGFAPIKRTSGMNTVEFEDYCSRVRRWALSEYGVLIPEPNEVEV